MIRRLSVAAAVLVLSALPAFAHLSSADHGSLAAGISHPIFGVDHVLAMVAVGLWAAFLGGKAIWMVPVAFVGAMLAGFVIALAGVALPFVEPVIAASVVALGLLSMTALRLPVSAGIALVGFFAFFHGHAHAGELGAAGAVSFAIGFAISTAFLHGIGLAIGRFAISPNLARIAGGLTAMAGLALAFGA